MITIVNCSTVYAGLPASDAVATARADGYDAVEFWWPFDSATPTPGEVEEFCGLFGAGSAGSAGVAGVKLRAMNLWGGDMAAGERGVLHRQQLPERHFEVVGEIASATGLKCSNVLLGRSGTVTHQQRDRLAEVALRLGEFGVTALIEPLSGMEDYPIRDPWAAAELAGQTGCAVLADFYHFAVNGVDVQAWLRDVEEGRQPLPGHVQVADFPGRGAPGSASLPLAEWVARLRAAGYAGEVAGEWT